MADTTNSPKKSPEALARFFRRQMRERRPPLGVESVQADMKEMGFGTCVWTGSSSTL